MGLVHKLRESYQLDTQDKGLNQEITSESCTDSVMEKVICKEVEAF